eukprot:9364593-Alexandrium_andersonii.AAC.1
MPSFGVQTARNLGGPEGTRPQRVGARHPSDPGGVSRRRGGSEGDSPEWAEQRRGQPGHKVV